MGDTLGCMDSERWKRIERIYHAVLACPPDGRAGVLDESCQSDPSLRDELESLLSARDEAGSFLSPEELKDHLAELAFEPADPVIGRPLSHYQVIAEIGSGAMGVVYRALDTRLDRQVALKILPVRFTHDGERVARFQREAKAASALNHPNIVTIYDVGQDGGTWFIAAELVEGVSLRECLRTRKLTLTEVVDIAVQCAAALQAAHRAGIVHRDIKPENIMLRPDGGVKVVDFGLASIATGQELAVQISQSGGIMGTPRYMSPEQARGRKLDSRSDIFSLGSVLYEMATGRAAFPGANAAEVFAALLGEADPMARGLPIGRPLDRILRKALAKDSEARYQTAEEFANELRTLDAGRSAPRFGIRAARVEKRYAALVAVALLAAGISLPLYFRHVRDQRPLTDQDTILLADFTNQTGDPVFEPTLKQGLAVQLEQSPLINTLSDARARETLRLMGRKPDDRITPEIAREICQRQGLKATIMGSIAPLGGHYAITLEAADSHSGATLARAQTEARSKEEVLKALSKGAAQLREKLGESLGSIQKYDALLERTTSSLEALQAYSLGYQERRRGRAHEAIPLLLKAVGLDPQFAYAYSDLATLYRNTARPGLAAVYAAKAYALRDRVSERERLRITSLYYEYVTGETDKEIEALKLYTKIYDRDPLPHNNLGTSYSAVGQYELALEESRAAMRLDPDAASRFATQSNDLVHLGRYAEAKEIGERAVHQKRDGISVHRELYRIAFVAGDTSAMEQQVAWASGKADEHGAFNWQAAAAAYRGEWHLSSEFARRAIDAAVSNGQEVVALYTSESALRGATLGKCAEARSTAAKALTVEHTQDSLPRAALALELCGETGERQALELIRRYPKNLIVTSVWLPIIRAAADIKRGNATAAIEDLRTTASYEAAAEFWPQFLRAQAHLRLGRGIESAAEFTGILDHRGQAVDSALYPLADLGLARAAVLLRDTTRARKSYQAFFTEWKHADADLPELVSAKKEFARLK